MCDTDVLPLFGEIERNVDILEKRIERVSSVNSSDTNHIKFIIAGTEEYIHLPKTTFYYKIRILKADGSNIDDNAEVALINYSGATVFEKLDISLGEAHDNILIHDNYNYLSFIQAQLTFDKSVKKTALTAGNFYLDTPKKFDTISNENSGFTSRKNASAESAYLECETIIHSGFFAQQKPLKNRIDLILEFTKCNDKFAIMAPTGQNYKLDISEPTIIIERLKLSPKLLNIYESQFLKTPITYSVERAKFFLKDVSDGLSSLTLRDFCDEKNLPKRIIFGMVSELAYSGSYNLNPMNFKSYKLKSLNMVLNGACITGKPIIMDFPQKQYLQAYTQTLKGLNFFGNKDACDLTKEQFVNGCTLFAFDLAPTCCSLNLIDPIRSGKLEIDLIFSVPTPEKFKAIIYSEYEDLFSINHLQRVTKTYS